LDAETTVHWLSQVARLELEIDQARAANGPALRRKQELEDSLQQKQGSLDELRRSSGVAARQARLREQDLRSLEARTAHLREQQDQIKDNKTYQALSGEISALSGQIDTLENTILGFLEDRERQEARALALQDECEQTRQDLDRLDEELARTAKLATERLEALGRELSLCEQQLPGDIAATIARLRTKMSLPVVRLDEQACGGCHAQFPAQIVLEIVRGASVVRCQTCGRYAVPSGLMTGDRS
jgi:predicted  nucleic acid-binding Zn-ribbon protein